MAIAPTWLLFPALLLIIGVRYLALALFSYLYFYRSKRWEGRRISNEALRPRQIREELTASLVANLFFAAAGVLILEGWRAGKIPVYYSVAEYGWFYFFFSIALMVFLHETYFYFTHRWMHRPAVFRRVHRVHHLSRNPTPFAAFSFHPLEAIVEAAILPLIVFLVPAHPAALLTFLLFMTVLGLTNHLGFEIYPAGSARHWFGRHWIGPTHHTQHHLRLKGNYGLYFTFWDRLLGTEFPDYAECFEHVTRKGAR